jgi:hypothetical protein
MNLDHVQTQADSLIKELQSILNQAATIEAAAKSLILREERARKLESELTTKITNFSAEKAAFEGEKRYVADEQKRLIGEENTLKIKESKLVIREEKIAKQEQEISTKLADLDTKLAEVKKLRQDQIELEQRQALLKKELLVDEERKRDLDLRRAANEAEAKRLQQLAQKWSAK